MPACTGVCRGWQRVQGVSARMPARQPQQQTKPLPLHPRTSASASAPPMPAGASSKLDVRVSLHQWLDSMLPCVEGSSQLRRLLQKRLDLRSGGRVLAAAARVALLE